MTLASARVRGRRIGVIGDQVRRELLMRGRAGTATVLSVRTRRGRPGHEFGVRVRLDGEVPYDARIRQRVRSADLEWMQPGDTVACRVDPGNHSRLVLYLPERGADGGAAAIAKILAGGRRAEATVLAATPIAADYTGRADPVLRLDLEMHAWDETAPWLVRIVGPVPLAAIGHVTLGSRLPVAFFTVDRGESVAVDWEQLS